MARDAAGGVGGAQVSGKGSAILVTDRWEGDDIHIYEYAPNSTERYFGTDTFKMAEGYVYNRDGFAIGYVYVVSAQDLRTRVALQKAIDAARLELERKLSKDLGGGAYETVQKIKENQTYLMEWTGRLLWRVL